MSAAGSATDLFRGFLRKKGRKSIMWRERLAVLTAVELQFFATVTSTETTGSIALRDIKALTAESHDCNFKITTQKKTYQLQAFSQQEKRDWVAALEGAMNGSSPGQMSSTKRGSTVAIVRTGSSPATAAAAAATSSAAGGGGGPRITATTQRGMLHKKGHVFKTWRRRLFVLDDQKLTYYKTTEHGKQLGSMLIHQCRVVVGNEAAVHDSDSDDEEPAAGAAAVLAEAEADAGPPYLFKLVSHHKTLIMMADSHHERQMWVDALRRNIIVARQSEADNRHALAPLLPAAGGDDDDAGEEGKAAEEGKDGEGASAAGHVTLAIFAGTFNMGEGSVPAQLSEWIQPGADVYAIGVQECINSSELKEGIRHVLQTEGEFVEFEEHIGSNARMLGYHGYIQLFVFVRDALADRAHAVERGTVKRGADLVVAKASNKGCVSLTVPISLHSLGATEEQVYITFGTMHLAADLHGRNRVEERNADAAEILAEIVSHAPTGAAQRAPRASILPAAMAAAEARKSTSGGHRRSISLAEEVGAPQHHILLFGDMNYRINLEPREALERVAACVQSTEDADWAWLAEVDQLSLARREDGVFPGFEEGTIRFPPTFRRVVGAEADPGDYTDVDTLLRCYTTEVEKDGQVTTRTPSYTDRILWKSSNTGALGQLVCRDYGAADTIRTSDHSPVFGSFTLELPARESSTSWERVSGNVPLSFISYFSVASLMRLPFFSLLVQYTSVDGATLATVDEPALQRVGRMFRLTSMAGGLPVYSQGDTGNQFFIIISGRVQVTTMQAGCEVVLATLSSPEWFGETVLIEGIGQHHHLSSVKTLEPCTFLSLTRRKFLELKRQFPTVAVAVTDLIKTRMASTLQSIPIFDGMGEDRLSLLASLFRMEQYGIDQPVFVEGEMGDCFCIVVSGKVKVTCRGADDTENLLTILRAGDYLGEISLLQSAPRSASVTTIEPCTFLTLGAVEFQNFLEVVPEMGDRIRAIVSARMANSLKKIPFFAATELKDQLRVLADLFTYQKFSDGQAVFTEGELDEAREFYVIVNGTCEVTVSGVEGPVRTMGPGDYLGEIALLRNSPRTATVTAVGGDLLVLALSAENFAKFLEYVPEMQTVFRHAMMSRLGSAANLLDDAEGEGSGDAPAAGDAAAAAAAGEAEAAPADAPAAATEPAPEAEAETKAAAE